MEFIKMKTCSLKATIKKMKKQDRFGENICKIPA